MDSYVFLTARIMSQQNKAIIMSLRQCEIVFMTALFFSIQTNLPVGLLSFGKVRTVSKIIIALGCALNWSSSSEFKTEFKLHFTLVAKLPFYILFFFDTLHILQKIIKRAGCAILCIIGSLLSQVKSGHYIFRRARLAVVWIKIIIFYSLVDAVSFNSSVKYFL